jgi:hypothetical protein
MWGANFLQQDFSKGALVKSGLEARKPEFGLASGNGDQDLGVNVAL